MADPARISPPAVLVTGASSGIGRKTAERFATEGFRVYGTSRRTQPGARGVRMMPLDLYSSESIHRCVHDVSADAGGIDVLVNNAGVMHQGFAEETTGQQAHEVFAANFFGTTELIRAVLPGMRQRRQGRIINIGSLAAWVGEPGEACYAASKAALARYTEALRHEVWHCGIGVSLVEPGAVTTNVVTSAVRAAASIDDYDGPRERARRVLAESLQGGGDPSEVAVQIVRIAQTRNPRLRYGIGREARWLPAVKTLLPQAAFDRLLRRSFKLPR